MSKIGIKINNISAGLAVAYQANVNIGGWATRTHDTRDDLRNLGFPDAAGNFVPFLVSQQAQGTAVYMLTFDTGGCYLCSLKASSGRVGDHVATWFYIPREADLTAARMRQFIELVDEEVMTGGIINESRLNDVFLRDVPDRPVLPAYGNSNPAAGYAVRYYGRGTEYSLDDLLGHDIYQPEYVRYKAVFLIDKASGLSCRGAGDLTARALARSVTVMPPRGNAMGFTPFLADKPFTAPILAYQGATMQLVWRREGFKDVVKPITLKTDPQQLPDLQEDELHWIVPYAHFSVIDDSRRNVPDCTITLYGKPLTPASPGDVPFAELKRGVRVKVSKQGYNDAVVDYKGKPVVVELEKARQSYVFVFPDGDKVTLSGSKTFEESPFKGYSANANNRVLPGGTNQLHKVAESSMPGGLNLKSLLIGAAAGALLVGAAWLLLSLFGGSPKPEPEASVSTEVSIQNQKPVRKSSPKFEALNAPVWTKQALEKAGFIGLWDALNSYDSGVVMNFDKKYPELRQQVPQWSELVDAIVALQSSGNPTLPGKYVNAGDEDITVGNYIKKIKNLTFPKKRDATTGATPTVPDKNKKDVGEQESSEGIQGQ